MADGSETILLPGQQIGLAFVVEVACASALATGVVLLYFIYLSMSWSGRAKIMRNKLNLYLISLFFADFIQAIGGIMDALWVDKGRVYEGPFCTAQGALKQAGDVGVAFSILAITVHTSAQLFLRWDGPETARVPTFVIGCIWLFIVLAVSLGQGLNHDDRYYGNTLLWCWIRSDHQAQQLGLEYAWLWFTVGVNLASFFAFLAMNWCTCMGERRPVFNATVAKRLALFPLVYMITVLPTSACRWLQFTRPHAPWRATIVSAVLFSSSGVLNVALFAFARAGLFDSTRGPALMHAPPAVFATDSDPAYKATGPSVGPPSTRSADGLLDPAARPSGQEAFNPYAGQNQTQVGAGDGFAMGGVSRWRQ